MELLILFLLQYLIVPLLGVWMIATICNKSAKEEQLRVDKQKQTK